MEKFNQFKSEILKRAKEVSACTSQYQRAYKSESFDQLFLVIKDNFFYCCNNKIIDPDLIESVKEEARECGVYHNESATNAFILGSGNCTIRGYENCTIEGSGNCTIRGYENCTIEGSGNCTIEGYDNCTIEGYDNCTIKGYDNCSIEGSGNCSIEGYGNCSIKGSGNCSIEGYDNCSIEGSGNCTIEGYGNCSIKGYGNSYLNVYSNMDCKISDHAIMRYRDTNEVVIVKGNLKVKTAKP